MVENVAAILLSLIVVRRSLCSCSNNVSAKRTLRSNGATATVPLENVTDLINVHVLPSPYRCAFVQKVKTGRTRTLV
jgi:hypothetical protein